MESLIVSACLLGVNCKYSGGNNLCPSVLALARDFRLIPVCPEQLGGLPTPRPPAECRGDRVVNAEGKDVTECFRRGAEETLRLAQLFGCRCAVLKAKSPSCGQGQIYDGSFSGTLTDGDGVTARLLRDSGIQILDENTVAQMGKTLISLDGAAKTCYITDKLRE